MILGFLAKENALQLYIP